MPCDPVTAEQLHYAHVVASAAATGRTPRQSFASLHDEAREKGQLDPTKRYLTLRDIGVNHAAFAIMDAFPEKTAAGDRLRQSLLWRVIFAAPEVFRDPRATPYMRKDGAQDMVARPLIEALATTPMAVGEKVPIDAVFKTAADISARDRE